MKKLICMSIDSSTKGWRMAKEEQ